MKHRCGPSSTGRNRAIYYARGIRVCEEWLDFDVFVTWAFANGWRQGLQLDRVDNDSGYEPSNCRYVTPAENGLNRRCVRRVTAWGETKTITEWVEDPRCAATASAIRERLFRGRSAAWVPEAALSTPTRSWVRGGPNSR